MTNGPWSGAATTIIEGSPFPWLPVVDSDEWQAAAVTLFRQLGEVATNRAPEPERTAAELRAAVRQVGPGARLVASLALEDHWPQQILVEAGAPDPDAETAVLVGAATPDPFGPVDVSEEDGTVVAVRRDLLDDASAIVSVSAVRRSPGLDVRVTWRSTALALIDPMRSELVDLASSVHLEEQP